MRQRGSSEIASSRRDSRDRRSTMADDLSLARTDDIRSPMPPADLFVRPNRGRHGRVALPSPRPSSLLVARRGALRCDRDPHRPTLRTRHAAAGIGAGAGPPRAAVAQAHAGSRRARRSPASCRTRATARSLSKVSGDGAPLRRRRHVPGERPRAARLHGAPPGRRVRLRDQRAGRRAGRALSRRIPQRRRPGHRSRRSPDGSDDGRRRERPPATARSIMRRRSAT